MNSTSTKRLKQIGLWAVALIFGLVCGRMVHSAIGSIAGIMDTGKKSVSQETSRGDMYWSSPMSESSRYLWREEAELRDPETYQSGVERLHRESLSPLRAVSVHSYRLQHSTFEEWELLIAEGKVTRLETLREVGDYLARLDPERAMRLIFNGPTRFQHLEQFYAFRDSTFDTLTEINPEMVLNALKSLPRGGSQMDGSRYFSECWAKRDPSAVAARFDELQGLRNMGLEGSSAQIPYDEFAGILMKSWVSKDVEAAEAYVAELSEGPKRDALQAAFEKFREAE